MEALAAWLEGLPLAETMRRSRWGYAAASTGHVAGLAALFGAVLALDLRLLGVWREPAPGALGRVLVPVAAGGLALAAACGALLLLAAPSDYLGAPLFLAKLGLVALGTGHALALHLGPGIAGASPARLRLAGTVSLLSWTGALVAGRMLAFVLE